MRRPTVLMNLSYVLREGAWRHEIKPAYIEAIWQAGGTPLLLPAHPDAQLGVDLAARADAFLFTGGPDYPPALYGANPEAHTIAMASERAQSDLAMARLALSGRRPVLGICAGCQLLAIAAGGRLIQHLPTAEQHGPTSGCQEPGHEVEVGAGRLASILGAGRHRVNSYHHQAVDPTRLPAGLIISARAVDGVVEAIQLPGEGLRLGVQWHPEIMHDAEHRRRLFGALIQAAMAPPPKRSVR